MEAWQCYKHIRKPSRPALPSGSWNHNLKSMIRSYSTGQRDWYTVSYYVCGPNVLLLRCTAYFLNHALKTKWSLRVPDSSGDSCPKCILKSGFFLVFWIRLRRLTLLGSTFKLHRSFKCSTSVKFDDSLLKQIFSYFIRQYWLEDLLEPIKTVTDGCATPPLA
ncbi:hypothetical protein BDY19DRAFT_745877 [Irpex rosettiformis]|uniref:Uncharacterized protein n=1 Tax=Irpex rosettiformis TaxID=378272 RepID=A0ACB8TMM1_9APHY|nr:hypothetical protein BDY19DRAFT_745877 [Irpex rosettiformis]